MFSLVEQVSKPKKPVLSMIKNHFNPGAGVDISMAEILGMRVMRASMEVEENLGPGGRLRRAGALRDAVMANGVRNVCFSKSFEFKDVFIDKYFMEMDSSALFRGLAPRIIIKAAGGDGTVAVFADVVYRENAADIMALCRDFRQVVIVARNAREYCDKLRSEYGVPAVGNPGKSIVERADAALILGEVRGKFVLKESCSVFALPGVLFDNIEGGGVINFVELSYPEEVFEKIPHGFPCDVIISAAIEYETFDINLVEVASVSKADLTEMNI